MFGPARLSDLCRRRARPNRATHRIEEPRGSADPLSKRGRQIISQPMNFFGLAHRRSLQPGIPDVTHFPFVTLAAHHRASASGGRRLRIRLPAHRRLSAPQTRDCPLPRRRPRRALRAGPGGDHQRGPAGVRSSRAHPDRSGRQRLDGGSGISRRPSPHSWRRARRSCRLRSARRVGISRLLPKTGFGRSM